MFFALDYWSNLYSVSCFQSDSKNNKSMGFDINFNLCNSIFNNISSTWGDPFSNSSVLGLLVKETVHCFWQPWQLFWCPFLEEFVQQINQDWALVFWHLSTGTDYKHRNGRSLYLAGLILTLISIHVFKDCCRNLSFTYFHWVCGVCWQRRRVTACQTVLFGSHRC